MFRTEIPLAPFPTSIDYSSKLLTLGSCFAQVIGNKLSDAKFNTLVNPYGTIFNPISLFKLLEISITREYTFLEQGMVFRDNRWYNFHLHSDLNAPSKEELILLFKEKATATLLQLKEADHLLITFGSAFVYTYKEYNCFVANCHKMPSALFDKELLTLTQLKKAAVDLIEKIALLNSTLSITLSVSPVRHVKDTLVANNLSKSILRVACDELERTFDQVNYFPAFELLNDDLRDYRFYKEDMIHPSSVAEDYIWEKFGDAFFSDDTRRILSSWMKLNKALTHKPFQSTSSAHQSFIVDTLQRLKSLSSSLDVSEEIANLTQRVASFEK